MSKPIDLSKILNPFKGKWVALSNDETKVVASGDSLKEVRQKAIKKRENDPIIFKVPDGFIKDYFYKQL